MLLSIAYEDGLKISTFIIKFQENPLGRSYQDFIYFF